MKTVFNLIIKQPEDGDEFNNICYMAGYVSSFICQIILFVILINWLFYYTKGTGANYQLSTGIIFLILPFIVYYGIKYILPVALLIGIIFGIIKLFM